jgi:hypothetical protein
VNQGPRFTSNIATTYKTIPAGFGRPRTVPFSPPRLRRAEMPALSTPLISRLARHTLPRRPQASPPCSGTTASPPAPSPAPRRCYGPCAEVLPRWVPPQGFAFQPPWLPAPAHLTPGRSIGHDEEVGLHDRQMHGSGHAHHDPGWFIFITCGCSSVVEHLLAKERVESSNLFIRLFF